MVSEIKPRITLIEADESLASQTYRTLRQNIILGHYAQGTRLVEAALATELHVSRLPIRGAVPQLENEGFVRTLHRRSARVAEWTSADVTELYDARLSLETLAARLAARAISAGASIQPLLDAIAAEHRALESKDWLAAAETSTLVHEAVVTIGASTLLTSLMRGITGRLTWLSYLTSDHDERHQSTEHHTLLDAIRSGNDRLAEAIMFAHIEKGRAPSLAMLTAPEVEGAADASANRAQS